MERASEVGVKRPGKVGAEGKTQGVTLVTLGNGERIRSEQTYLVISVRGIKKKR